MKSKILFLLFLCSNIAFSQKTSVKNNGQLHVDGVFLKNSKNKNIVLRGVSYGWSNEHFRFYNENSVAWLKKDWNVSVVRATIGIEPSNGYLEAPLKTTNYINDLIEAAIKNDLYIVLAWHCNNKHLPQSIDFFVQIAKKYSKYPNVIYEIFTEPDDETWTELKPYYLELVKSIREYDAKNIILLSAPFWSQNIKQVADDPILGLSNIMYTVHFCTGSSGQLLRDDCNYALSKGVPIIITDHLLTDCSCDSKLFLDEWNKWITWFELNKISWITWSVSDKKESCSFLVPNACSNGNWSESELNESGNVVRKKLIELNK